MSQYITYELNTASIGTGETAVGSITAANTNDIVIVSVQGTLFDTATSNPPVTWRVRHATSAGTGSTNTGQKVDGSTAAAITSTAKDTMTVIPTGLTTMDGATIAFNQPYLRSTLPLKVKSGDFVAFTVERPGATGTPNARVFVTVLE